MPMTAPPDLSALPALPDVPRPPWRALALLTPLVVVAHLALLWLAPLSEGVRPSPLASQFITRTIVIAPPVAEAPPTAPVAAAAAPAPPPKPARPRPTRARAPKPATPPPPAPAPAVAPAMAEDATKRDLIARNAIDADMGTETAPAASTSSSAAPAESERTLTSGEAASASTSSSQTASGNDSGGQVEGAAPMRIPGSVRLSFEATGQQGSSPMKGVFGELVWLQDGQQYDARLSLTLLFRTVRSQHSTGVIGATGIEPTRFSEKRRSEVASHFVRDEAKIVFSNNSPSVPLLPGAQDRLSIVMQIGALIAGDPARYLPGGALAIQTAGPRDADIWIFKVEGDETLHLPAGDFVSRKLVRNPRKPFDDKLELWVAPELGWLPVRIRQTQSDGDFADLQLREAAPVKP